MAARIRHPKTTIACTMIGTPFLIPSSKVELFGLAYWTTFRYNCLKSHVLSLIQQKMDVDVFEALVGHILASNTDVLQRSKITTVILLYPLAKSFSHYDQFSGLDRMIRKKTNELACNALTTVMSQYSSKALIYSLIFLPRRRLNTKIFKSIYFRKNTYFLQFAGLRYSHPKINFPLFAETESVI